MKVTLVYVCIGVAGFNPHRERGDREGSWIGHGVASIGATLKAAGHQVDLIDLRQLGGWHDLAALVKANPSQVYGLSISPVDQLGAYLTVFTIKTTVPEAKIIIGGIHPTIFPEEYDFKVIDCVVQGEGELAMQYLVEDIAKGMPIPKKLQAKKPSLDALPWVDRELFDYSRELSCYFAPNQATPSVSMLAGRGCPYHCAYCQPAENAVFGKPHRMRSPENVIAELVMLKKRYDFKSLTFWDDTFTFNHSWVFKFCDLYEKENFGANISACSRADIICNNEDMIERMASIGIDWLVIGIESGNQRILNLINKGVTVEQNRKALQICRKYGIKAFATVMMGLPTETNREMEDTVRFINETNPEVVSPFWYVPIPGTKLYDFCKKNSLLLDDSPMKSPERTGKFVPTLKGVDYEHIRRLMPLESYSAI